MKGLRNPVLLVSLSTSNPQYQVLYSQARELANYLLRKSKFERFASFYSSSLPPAVIVSKEGIAELVGVHFYLNIEGARDLILLAGFASPQGDEYEFGMEVLSFAKKLGVTELISTGARWNEEPIPPLEMPQVLGFASDEVGVKWLEDNGVHILKDESAFYFANTIIGMAQMQGIRGYKLSVNHGEPTPHPKSIAALLGIISKKVGMSFDTSDLEQGAKELAEVIRSSGYELQGARAGEGQDQRKEDIYR